MKEEKGDEEDEELKNKGVCEERQRKKKQLRKR